jgi:hypothetical protein
MALDIAGGKIPAFAALPMKVGQCAAIQVAEVHPLLEGSADYTSGIGVELKNRGHQVSYEDDAAMRESRSGDDVVMCLTSIPRRCPPGDVRGRIYTTTDLRSIEPGRYLIASTAAAERSLISFRLGADPV